MARTNFKFNKRQKELERKKKQEEKRQRKLGKRSDAPEATLDQPHLPVTPDTPAE